MGKPKNNSRLASARDEVGEVLAFVERLSGTIPQQGTSTDSIRVEAGFWRGVVTGIMLGATPEVRAALSALAAGEIAEAPPALSVPDEAVPESGEKT